MIERVFGAAFLISVIIREFLGINFDGLVFISGTLLASTYLFANWWISKPNERNLRTIALTLIYGFTSFSLTLSLVFQLLFYPGSSLLSILSVIFLIIALGIDFISSRERDKVPKKSIVWRFGILTALVSIFYVVPQDNRVRFTYRDHPDFLEYYRINKGKMDFVELKDEFFKSPQEKRHMLSIENQYLALDTAYTAHEAFNDSICQIAIDSANKRFSRNKFELYAFFNSDSSGTPIHLLQNKFRLRVVAFAHRDFVFKFCFNHAMISAFETRHHFNPLDSVKVIYDSLLGIGQTQANAKFPGGIEEFKRYITCNLELPEGVNLSPPYPTVRVSFRVSPTGHPDEIKITKSHSSKYDSAVLRMIRSMPKWIPGQGDYGTYEAHLIQWSCIFNPIKKEKDCR